MDESYSTFLAGMLSDSAGLGVLEQGPPGLENPLDFPLLPESGFTPADWMKLQQQQQEGTFWGCQGCQLGLGVYKCRVHLVPAG